MRCPARVGTYRRTLLECLLNATPPGDTSRDLSRAAEDVFEDAAVLPVFPVAAAAEDDEEDEAPSEVLVASAAAATTWTWLP